jgi:uncharacterized protein YjbI with pentapeptide repeats
MNFLEKVKTKDLTECDFSNEVLEGLSLCFSTFTCASFKNITFKDIDFTECFVAEAPLLF